MTSPDDIARLYDGNIEVREMNSAHFWSNITYGALWFAVIVGAVSGVAILGVMIVVAFGLHG